MGLSQLVNDFFTRVAALARGMSETTAAYAILNIENEIVAWAWRDPHGYGIQS
jgi:hypothetical protein